MKNLGKSLRNMAIVLLLLPLAIVTPRQAFSAWEMGAPIITYWGSHPLTEETAQRAVAGGYNFVSVHSWEELDLAEQYGLRARLRSDYYLGNLLWPESLDGGARQAQLDALIDQYKTHPAAYAYFINMVEPKTRAEIDSWAPLIAYLRERDPDRLNYVLMGAPSWAGNSLWQHYIRTVNPQMIYYDWYNLFEGFDDQNYLANLTRVANFSKLYEIPFINEVQACIWVPDPTTWRLPNENELRFLVYSTLAYGARGISYFNYYTDLDGTSAPGTGGIQFNPDGTPTEVYTALATLNPQFEKVAEQLQPFQWIGTYLKGYTSTAMPPWTEQLPSTSPFDIAGVSNTMVYNTGDALKGVLFGLFDTDGAEAGDATAVLVANLDYSLGKTYTLTGPGNLSVFDATTGVWTATGGNQAILNLPPGGGILVSLTPIPGDANRDGFVDELDAAVLAQHWLQSGNWHSGDFNGDLLVNDLDATLLAANWTGSPSASVPEPGTLVLLAGMLLLAAHKRRPASNM